LALAGEEGSEYAGGCSAGSWFSRSRSSKVADFLVEERGGGGVEEDVGFLPLPKKFFI